MKTKSKIKLWLIEHFGFTRGFSCGYEAGLEVGGDLCQNALYGQKKQLIQTIKSLPEEPTRQGMIDIVKGLGIKQKIMGGRE